MRKRHPPVCEHAGEINRKGLCDKCYMREYYKKNKKRLDASKTEWRLRREYGISLEMYQEMKKDQDHRCFICNKRRKLFVDHDHKTGAVRKLLCSGCNFRVGMMEKKLGHMFAALDYLYMFHQDVRVSMKEASDIA